MVESNTEVNSIVEQLNNLEFGINDRIFKCGIPHLDYTVPFPEEVCSYGEYLVKANNGKTARF